MNRINYSGSRKSICNLLSDFILKKIGFNSNTVVQVTDCVNFFVINGISETNNFLDTKEILEEFNSKYEHILSKPISHSFDFIKYGLDLEPVDFLRRKYFLTSDNTSYHYSLVELFRSDESKNYIYNGVNSFEEKLPPDLSVSSDFPHGYSLPQGRSLHYYGKMISYNLSGISLCTELEMQLYTRKNELREMMFDLSCKDFSEESLKSFILDTFDFNYSKMENDISEMDLTEEVLNPLNEFPCVRNKVDSDLFIL
jgi:hypothetical protein